MVAAPGFSSSWLYLWHVQPRLRQGRCRMDVDEQIRMARGSGACWISFALDDGESDSLKAVLQYQDFGVSLLWLQVSVLPLSMTLGEFFLSSPVIGANGSHLPHRVNVRVQ